MRRAAATPGRSATAQPEDRTHHAYGAAFVLLAYACACRAGIEEARPWMEETWALLEARFWDADAGLYRDEADARLAASAATAARTPTCTCARRMLAAYQASGAPRYLERALTLADHMTRRQAAQGRRPRVGALRRDWNLDWDYHREEPQAPVPPLGLPARPPDRMGQAAADARRALQSAPAAQPGAPAAAAPPAAAPGWLVPRAQALFDAALARAWDDEYGGLYYGFAPDGSVCDRDKYFWVQAESLAAAALLAARAPGTRTTGTGTNGSGATRGGISSTTATAPGIASSTADNRRYDDEKSPAGKTDYHTMGACHEVLHLLRSAH